MTTPKRTESDPAVLDAVTQTATIRWGYLRDAAQDHRPDLSRAIDRTSGDPAERWRFTTPPELIIAAMDTEVRHYGEVMAEQRATIARLESTVRALRLSARRLLAEADPATLAELQRAVQL